MRPSLELGGKGGSQSPTTTSLIPPCLIYYGQSSAITSDVMDACKSYLTAAPRSTPRQRVAMPPSPETRAPLHGDTQTTTGAQLWTRP